MVYLRPGQRINTQPIDERNILLVKTFRTYLPEGVLETRKGAISDGASGPVMGLAMLGLSRYDNRIKRAAFVHDQLYRTKLVSRKRADDIFMQICIEDGLDKARALVIRRVLGVFGWCCYGKGENTGHTSFEG